MEQLQKIFTSFKSLIGFMILCIFMEMLLGKKVLERFLWLVLFSMIIINSDKFVKVIQPTN